MSAEDKATERQKVTSIPIRTLRVKVVGGPEDQKSVTAETEKLSVGSAEGNDLVLEDRAVSRYHLELLATPEGMLVVDHGSTNGTYVAGAVRIGQAIVPLGTKLKVGSTTIEVTDGKDTKVQVLNEDHLEDLRGRTPVMRRLMAQVERVAKKDVPILLHGESGTGKELVAEAIHELGNCSDGPFVTVDCAALSPSLLESELFGHERGAFTGAHQRYLGAFERASGGTLFLDEIAELPAPSQSSLLGALARRRIRRIGGDEDIPINIRVVSATHRELRSEVNQKSFRLDLYYRLATVTLKVPPLRERRDDILFLAEHFLSERRHNESIDDVFSPETRKAMVAHHWPGNVRELRNFVEATIALGEAPGLATKSRGSSLVVAEGLKVSEHMRPYYEARDTVLHDFDVEYLTQALKCTRGNVSLAAREAGLSRSHFYRLLRRHNLDRD